MPKTFRFDERTEGAAAESKRTANARVRAVLLTHYKDETDALAALLTDLMHARDEHPRSFRDSFAMARDIHEEERDA